MLWKHESQTIIVIVSTAFQLLTNFHETVFLFLFLLAEERLFQLCKGGVPKTTR